MILEIKNTTVQNISNMSAIVRILYSAKPRISILQRK